MKLEEVIEIISSCLDDVVFTYDDKYCSVTSFVIDSVPTFRLRFGDEVHLFHNANDLAKDKMFNGKSLAEIIDTLSIELY